eukprot:1037379-Alexandrium_andersonii.AAC.1
MAVERPGPGKRDVAQGVRSLSCAGPGTTSKSVFEDLEGWVMRRCSRTWPNPVTNRAGGHAGGTSRVGPG